MTKTLIKSRYTTTKYIKPKPNYNPEIKNNTSTSLPTNLKSFKDKLLSGNGFSLYK